MLLGQKGLRSSHKVCFIDLSRAEDRTRILRDDKSLSVLPDDSEDIAAAGREEHYCQLDPVTGPKLTFCQFVMWLDSRPGYRPKAAAQPCGWEDGGDSDAERPRGFESEVEEGGDVPMGDAGAGNAEGTQQVCGLRVFEVVCEPPQCGPTHVLDLVSEFASPHRGDHIMRIDNHTSLQQLPNDNAH